MAETRHLGTRRPAAAYEEQSAARYWRRHGQLGIALALATVVAVLGYAWLSHPRADRWSLTLLALGAGAGSAAVGLLVPAALARGRHLLLFYGWSLGTVGAILAAAALDGGDESPVSALLFMPLLYAALAYPAVAVVVLGAVELVGFVAVGGFEPESTEYTSLFAVTLALGTAMAGLSAHNRERQRLDLLSLTLRLETEAVRDPLTGCLNRRGFGDALHNEVARADRYHRPLTMLFIDVDRLKDINDRHGHAAGDLTLRCVASTMHSVARQTDVLGRLGGDEFAMLLPETTLDEAEKIAERLHAEVRAASPTHEATISIGAVAADSDSPEQLLKRADAALYVAKRSGRDRTEVMP